VIRGRVLGAGTATLFAVLLISGCGSTSHTAEPGVTSAPSHASASTNAGSASSATDTAAPQEGAQDQSSQIAAIEHDVSQANAADSQVQIDLNAAAAAQAQNDSP
jgi:hypothetical protein